MKNPNDSGWRIVQLFAASLMGAALTLGLTLGDVEKESQSITQEVTEYANKYDEVGKPSEVIRSEGDNDVRVVEESLRRAETFEGFEGEVYSLNGLCHIGYGHLTNCDNPDILSQTEAAQLLHSDLVVIYDQLDAVINDFEGVHPNIQVVLMDMGLNMGVAGLLKFEDMFYAFSQNDLWGAMMAIEDSLYFEQVNSRAEANIDLLYVLLEQQQNQPPRVSF